MARTITACTIVVIKNAQVQVVFGLDKSAPSIDLSFSLFRTCTSSFFEAPRLQLVVLGLLENDNRRRMRKDLESRRGSKKILIHACKTSVGRVQRSTRSWLDENKGTRSMYVLKDAVVPRQRFG
mgnify:CR=1